jgi:hypothetical protein
MCKVLRRRTRGSCRGRPINLHPAHIAAVRVRDTLAGVMRLSSGIRYPVLRDGSIQADALLSCESGSLRFISEDPMVACVPSVSVSPIVGEIPICIVGESSGAFLRQLISGTVSRRCKWLRQTRAREAAADLCATPNRVIGISEIAENGCALLIRDAGPSCIGAYISRSRLQQISSRSITSQLFSLICFARIIRFT